MENKLSRDAMMHELLKAVDELTKDEQILLLSMLKENAIKAAG